jgi:uncharacterized protein
MSGVTGCNCKLEDVGSRRTGYANLPLHSGRAPAWLFSRMARLAREITVHVVADRGPEEMLRRLSDPFWFQAFGCVLGFDWHSSGVTTTVTGAMKEGLRGLEHDLAFFAQGGKGATSRKTPYEILARCDQLSIDAQPLVHASRMAAKVDSAAVQDGYQLYHHSFFFTARGDWCVVQQGMNDATGTARRYHWLSESLESFVSEPHEAICSDVRGTALNLVSAEHEPLRRASVELATGNPDRVVNVVRRFSHHGTREQVISAQLRLPLTSGADADPVLDMPERHALMLEDVDPRRLHTVLTSTYDRAPDSFERLLGLEGVGGRTLRALALVSEVIFGTPASTRDPARFAFAHGGKDGTPFPVDRETYDKTIDILHSAMRHAKIDRSEKVDALKRLSRFARVTERALSGDEHFEGSPGRTRKSE